jgi:catechol 2,3-dioxygenase-like lactoylglutathione lyase family enzyme
MEDRFHHIGLVVADLERSLGFYRDVVGLELLARGAESDVRYAEMLGRSRVQFSWAELDLGSGHVLELLRFDEPSGGALRTAAETPGAGLPGVAHVGLLVDDIDVVHDALVKDGVTVMSRPIELAEENRWLGVRVFYALDPDNHLVELIQEAPTDRP